jgi:hypothetical protein
MTFQTSGTKYLMITLQPVYLPLLPSLRTINSSEYLTPLPLYGSGGRSLRMIAAKLPTTSLSGPEIVKVVLASTCGTSTLP